MGLGTKGGKQEDCLVRRLRPAAIAASVTWLAACGGEGMGWLRRGGRCPWRFQAGAFGAGVQGSSVLRVFTYAPGLPVPARSAALVSGASYAWPALSVWYSDFS
jgi:hypothetical protein